MTSFNRISRAEWRARPARSGMAIQPPPTEAFIHYTDSARAGEVDTLEEVRAAMRSIQTYHLDTQGWSDIGYHFVVFQPTAPAGRSKNPSICDGRDVLWVPAAQKGHNTGTLAISVYAGPKDTIRDATLEAISSILRAHPSVRTLGGHRDVVATDCPGDRLYSKLPRLAKASKLKVYAR